MTAKRVKATKEFTERDLKELRRLIGKYGRNKVATALRNIELPARGRPPKDHEEALELKKEIAYYLFEKAKEYREAGSRKPVEEALIDLHSFLAPEQPYERWRKTTLRKISGRTKRDVEALLTFAKETAVNRERFKEAAKKSRD